MKKYSTFSILQHHYVIENDSFYSAGKSKQIVGHRREIDNGQITRPRSLYTRPKSRAELTYSYSSSDESENDQSLQGSFGGSAVVT